jgi:hypothetical protein
VFSRQSAHAAKLSPDRNGPDSKPDARDHFYAAS